MGAGDFWGNAAGQLTLCVGGCSAEFFVFLSQQHMVFSLVSGLGLHVGLLCLHSVGEAQQYPIIMKLNLNQ